MGFPPKIDFFGCLVSILHKYIFERNTFFYSKNTSSLSSTTHTVNNIIMVITTRQQHSTRLHTRANSYTRVIRNPIVVASSRKRKHIDTSLPQEPIQEQIQEPVKEQVKETIPTFPVQIDFREAHEEWMSNKRRMGNGTYVYLCRKPLNSGKLCNRKCKDTIGFNSGCTQHYQWEEKAHKDPLSWEDNEEILYW